MSAEPSSTCPPNEIERTYHAYGAAADLLLCNAPEVLIEGAAGTGKTRAVLHKVADLCEAYAGLRALICRATRTSCTESILVTLERDVLPPGNPWEVRDVSRAQRDSYRCANGSVIVVGGLDHPERLYSTEWDVVYVAEALEITEDAWERFARAMRNKAIPLGVGGGPLQDGEARQPGLFWTQRIADCNPGAPGHWLNQRAMRGDMVRLRSRHEDNPTVTEDFLNGLRNLSGFLRARLYEGRWKSAEGAVFPEFDEDKHVCTPFPIPKHWPCYVAKDPGRDHPDATLVCAVSPSNQLFLCAESVVRGTTTAVDAKVLTGLCQSFNVVRKLGDPHYMFSVTKHSDTGRTIAQQMNDFGHSFLPAPAARNQAEIAQQVEMIRTLLTSVASDGTPMLQVFRSCPCTIRGFQTWGYVRDTQGQMRGGEDKFEDKGDDEMDCVRMLVASRPRYKVAAFSHGREE